MDRRFPPVLEIRPAGAVRGEVDLPGSKSITQRAILVAALAEGPSRIVGALRCDDSERMVDGIVALGGWAKFRGSSEAAVEGTGGALASSPASLDVGNAGTAMRFLAAAAALGRATVTLDGTPRMRERPIGPLVAALNLLGAKASCRGGFPPAEVEGPLPGGRAAISGAESSQFLSGLLMAGSKSEKGCEIAVEGLLVSEPYVAMTRQVLAAFGGRSQACGTAFSVPGRQRLSGRPFDVEPDASTATYFLAAAAATRGSVLVRRLRFASVQPDASFAEVLARMGASVRDTDRGILCEGKGPLRGIEADLGRMPDSVPTLAALALLAEGETRIRGVAHLRYKESDRLAALAAELTARGAAVDPLDDGLAIQAPPRARLQGGLVKTHDDHRLAMAFAVLGLAVPGIKIENPACVTKSCPGFFDLLESIRP